jgi:hypothetical protein
MLGLVRKIVWGRVYCLDLPIIDDLLPSPNFRQADPLLARAIPENQTSPL